MKTISARGLALIAFSMLLACGGNKPLPKEPEALPVEPPTPESFSTPVTAEPAASNDPNAEPPPPEPPIKETIGTVAKIEVQDHGKKKFEITKAADVDAFLKAVGTDQSPTNDLRKCSDDIVAVLKDKDAAEKGSIGVCRSETLGPEFWPPNGERKGLSLADEAAFKKALKLTDKAAKPAAPEKKKSGPKK